MPALGIRVIPRQESVASPAEVAGLGLWGKLILGSVSRRVHGNVHFRKINHSEMFLFFLFEEEDEKMLTK